MIMIDSVTKDFEAVSALSDVSLKIENGSIFGLIGSNGSGKSTLLKILCGVYKTTDGNVTYDGLDVYENSEVKKKIVFLSDDQYFMPNSSTADMAELYKCVYPTFSEAKYSEYLKIFGIDEKRKINTFSKGMQKQVSVILGLASMTEYLFCDETLDGLDPVMRKTVRSIVAAEVAERGMCVVFASHNLKEIEDICDHVALLHKGKLLFEAGLDDVKFGIHKVQVSFERDKCALAEQELSKLNTVSLEKRGSLFTLVVRGSEEEISAHIKELNPLFVEFIPLTLEEIFISEMEDRGYEFREEFIG